MRRGDPTPPQARDEQTGPFGRIDQQVAPHDHLYDGATPAPSPHGHESTRLYRRARVTAS